MKNFSIINGGVIYLKLFSCLLEAQKWANSYCDLNKPLFISEYQEIIEFKQFTVSLN